MHDYLTKEYERRMTPPPRPLIYLVIIGLIWMTVAIAVATLITKTARITAMDRMQIDQCIVKAC